MSPLHFWKTEPMGIRAGEGVMQEHSLTCTALADAVSTASDDPCGCIGFRGWVDQKISVEMLPHLRRRQEAHFVIASAARVSEKKVNCIDIESADPFCVNTSAGDVSKKRVRGLMGRMEREKTL